MTSEIRRARAAFLWVGLILPLVLLVLSAVLVMAWLPQLPDPVAIHWGTDGVDGFGPRWMALLPPAIGIVLVALIGVSSLFAHRLPQRGAVVVDDDGVPRWSSTARFLGAMDLATGVLMAVLSVAATAIQRGIADAADAPDIGPWVLLAFAAAVLAGVVGWFAQPRIDAPAPRAAGADETPIAPSERAAWFGSVSIALAGRVVLGTGVLLVLGSMVLMFATGNGSGWLLLGLAVLLLVLVSCGLAFRVRVGADGLQVRSFLGWPNTRIPLADIDRVEVTTIDPFAEFGGWGWRIATDGRRGVVLRRGEALQITRRSGRVFVVTVTGAAEAAAVLEGLRAHQAPPSS